MKLSAPNELRELHVLNVIIINKMFPFCFLDEISRRRKKWDHFLTCFMFFFFNVFLLTLDVTTDLANGNFCLKFLMLLKGKDFNQVLY